MILTTRIPCCTGDKGRRKVAPSCIVNVMVDEVMNVDTNAAKRKATEKKSLARWSISPMGRTLSQK